MSDSAISTLLPGPTFKTRVEHFWEWYASRADYFYRAIEDGRCSSLSQDVSRTMDEFLPGFSWCFGPGEADEGHSFTLSGGVRPMQMLAEYWKIRAPDLEGWTFYSARQAGKVAGQGITVQGFSYRAEEVWITPSIDEVCEVIDLTVWHPRFSRVDEKQKIQVIYLWLDEMIGELAVSRYIGEIRACDDKLRQAIPVTELRDYIETVKASREWARAPREGVVYRSKKPSDRALRLDIIAGYSECYRVPRNYLREGGPTPDDPLRGTGAEFLFIAFDIRNLPGKKLVDERDLISSRIQQRLGEEESGRVFGGAIGDLNAYIDFLIYDGERSISQVRRSLREVDLPYGATIHPFYQSRDMTPILV